MEIRSNFSREDMIDMFLVYIEGNIRNQLGVLATYQAGTVVNIDLYEKSLTIIFDSGDYNIEALNAFRNDTRIEIKEGILLGYSIITITLEIPSEILRFVQGIPEVEEITFSLPSIVDEVRTALNVHFPVSSSTDVEG